MVTGITPIRSAGVGLLSEVWDADFGRMVGSIYDAVIDADLWPQALDPIRQKFNFQNAMLSVIGLKRGNVIHNVEVNVPPEFQGMNDDHHWQEAAKLWGGMERVKNLPLEEPLVMSEGWGSAWEAMLEANGYYHDFAKPQGIFDVCAIYMARDPSLMAGLGLGRHRSMGHPGKAEIDGLRLLAPHLRRAVTISSLLDIAATAAASFQDALDATPAGVVLVDPQMTLVHANATAETMMRLGDPIQSRRGKIELRLELVPGQLQAAVEAASLDEAVLGRRGIGIPTRRLDGSPLLVNIMPLERRTVRGGLSSRASAAIFIADASGPPRLPADALTLLFGLTPAEIRVFELILSGHRSAEMAKALGIAPSTFKTHLLRVYEKTGLNTRADLVKLARKINLPA